MKKLPKCHHIMLLFLFLNMRGSIPPPLAGVLFKVISKLGMDLIHRNWRQRVEPNTLKETHSKISCQPLGQRQMGLYNVVITTWMIFCKWAPFEDIMYTMFSERIIYIQTLFPAYQYSIALNDIYSRVAEIWFPPLDQIAFSWWN